MKSDAYERMQSGEKLGQSVVKGLHSENERSPLRYWIYDHKLWGAQEESTARNNGYCGDNNHNLKRTGRSESNSNKEWEGGFLKIS